MIGARRFSGSGGGAWVRSSAFMRPPEGGTPSDPKRCRATTTPVLATALQKGYCPLAITFPIFFSRNMRLKFARSVLTTASSRFRKSANCDSNIDFTSCC